MASLGRRIEPKPPSSANISDAIPLLLVPVGLQPTTVAFPTQIIPRTIFIGAQSLQTNMDSNGEGLHVKLGLLPAQGNLIQRSILPGEGGDRPGSVLQSNKERDSLKRKIEQRPSKQKLVTQHILLTASNADPSIQRKAEVLKRCKLKDDLNKKLQHRPGPLELVTKKILQADAELEQAIQEGRVPFTKTTQERSCEIENKDSDMEVISSSSTSSGSCQRKLPNVCLGKSRVRKKSSQYRTPYDQAVPSPNAKSKLKLQDSATIDNQDPETVNDGLLAHGVSYVSDNGSVLNVSDQNENTREVQSSYDLLLQQQQLFLQWQREVEESRTLGTLQVEERRHCADECATSSATSPPCSMTRSAHGSLVGTECILNGTPTVIQEQIQESQQIYCQCSSANVNDSGISCETVNSMNDNSNTDKPKARLSDYRVQDLKNECKKRQLPVSGAKPQLLERLKPYEESILNQCIGQVLTDPLNDLVPVPSPVSDVSTQSNRLPPISNVIGDYVHKHSVSPLIHQQRIQSTSQQQQPQQQQQLQQHSLLVQLPSAQQHQHQVLQLVDANGAVVATATVPSNMQCCCMSSEYPLTTNNTTLNCATTATPTTITAQTVNNDRSRSDTVVQHQRSVTQVVQNLIEQVHTEPTFSFAQLGSGGQFTLVRTSSVEHLRQQTSSPLVIQSSHTGQHLQQQQHHVQLVQSTGNQACTQQPQRPSTISSDHCPARTATVQQVIGGGATSVLRSSCGQQRTQILHTTKTASSCPTIVKQPQNCHSQLIICNNITRHIAKEGTAASQNALCPPMQSTQPHCSPVTADSASGSSPDIPSPPNNNNNNPEKVTVVEAHPIHIDPSDTNALLSATTLSIHEEMLRFQQRKIEELQKELHRSQQQLKHQQQVILAAKKAQQAKRQEDAQQEGGSQQQSEADLWLNQLDIKHLNKFHIQLFLQHKLQQQQMQAQITEQQNLASTEEKLQEELHIEQAVQDIVRLIKQDARTALLIVQLLRRYQLERSQAVTATTQSGEDHNCEMEMQPSIQVEPNSQTPTITLSSRSSSSSSSSSGMSQQGLSSVDITMEPIQGTPQQKANTMSVINEDGVQKCAPATTPHPKPKSRKKTVSRAKSVNAEKQERTSGGVVDMEEIFKQVLENASKALMESDAEKRSKTNIDFSPSCAVEEFQVQKTVASNCSEYQEQGSCHTEVSNSATATALPGCEQLMQPYVLKEPFVTSTYGLSQGMETDMTDSQYEERVEVLDQGAVGTSQTFQYSKSQAFDDLMDVLRDDQACAGETKSDNLGFGTETVYGSDELASLLGDDWFPQDCTMSSTPVSSTPVCSQASEQYIADNSNAVTEQTDNLGEGISSQNDSLMSSYDNSQIVDQNMGMDWLDMVLPCPSPVHVDMDTSMIDSIR